MAGALACPCFGVPIQIFYHYLAMYRKLLLFYYDYRLYDDQWQIKLSLSPVLLFLTIRTLSLDFRIFSVDFRIPDFLSYFRINPDKNPDGWQHCDVSGILSTSLARPRARDYLSTGYGKSVCYASLPWTFDSLCQPNHPSIICAVTPLTAISSKIRFISVAKN